MMRKNGVIFLLAAFLCLEACDRRPSNVIAPDKMAELMADLNTGDAVMDVDKRAYRDSTSRIRFKEAIYEKHGVSAEEVDSSLAWYGRNISNYIEVCDKSIEILERRLATAGSSRTSISVSAHGDSVDIWANPAFIFVRPTDGSSSLTFLVENDENSEIGDIYTWRAKFDNISSPAEWGIVSEYDDGMIETLNSSFSNSGWHEINFFTDSTKTLNKIYGFLRVSEKNTFIDSLSLIRKRSDSDLYSQRYRQRKIINLKGLLSPVSEKE